ncbi:MAG: ATPase domain-containing protein [Candidatus Woesearchaeota archaeon]
MKTKEAILKYLKKTKQPSSTHDISKAVKKPWHSVHNRLLRLELEGKVNSHRLKRLNLWYLDNQDFPKYEDGTKTQTPLKKEPIPERKVPSGDPQDREERLKQISKERRKAKEIIERAAIPEKKRAKKEYIWTGIEGFDKLLDFGIPKKSAVIVAGGTGSGKTIFCLQIMYNTLKKGKKCLFLTLEESKERLIDHMGDFGWEIEEYINNKQLLIHRINPFDLKRSMDALLAQIKGELLIEVDPIILPGEFDPDIVFVDSLTAIAAAFTGQEETYRIYIEQFFRYLEKTKATSFLISETDQIPTKYSPTGTEEFLADGVIVLYITKNKSEKAKGIEILKLRGGGHQRKIVPFIIENKKGITIYPEKELYVEI